ncbi:hypothetical protein UPYG_G00206350 [Umbra pygmaea]|uniref:YqaJ viral recombinase domain-containing protein n=1 Tax=Umbra pygmaea TaxID=75934 RepID=A0ABD0WNZ4_UMBPY
MMCFKSRLALSRHVMGWLPALVMSKLRLFLCCHRLLSTIRSSNRLSEILLVRQRMLWSAYRKKRITASNFGLVLAAVKRSSYPPSLFKTLLGQYNLKEGSKACDWGILHEPRAKQQYTEHTGDVIQESGLFLSDSGLLGGSPHGTVSCDCMIEVKCPWSARTKTILQAAESRDFFLEVDEVTGSLTLKKLITTGTKSRATYP